MNYKKRIAKAVLTLAAILGVLLLYYLLVTLIGRGIPCVFHEITGLKCPGCGNTHAFSALLRLDFKEALRQNSLVFLEIIYILLATAYSTKEYIKTGKFNLCLKPEWINIAFLTIFLAWGIARNIF